MGAASSVRLAVVGAGGWGRNHVRTCAELGLLALVCDTDQSRREAAARDHDVDTTASFEDVLASEVDGVVLATPAETHADLAVRALDAGKHVLVEKPMALSADEARRMQDAATAAGRVLMVDHVLEYHPAVRKLNDMVAEGELGRILYLSSHRLNFGRVRTEEDSLWSFAPHDLSMMTNLLGALPTEVSCRGGAYLTDEVSDVTLMHLDWAGGIRGYVFVSWLHPFKVHQFVVVGDRQMAVFDDTLPWERKLQLYPHRVDWVDGRTPVAHRADAVPVQLDEAQPLTEATRHFADCITTGTAPITGPENGLAVVELLEAGRRSLETRGATVPLRAPVREPKFFVHPTAIVDDGASIGEGTKIWHHTHVMPNATVGANVVLGQDCYVGSKASIGDGVRVQNNVSIYDAVTLEDDVFVGPSAVFTNVVNPRSEVQRKDAYAATIIRRGASLGANSTIVCPVDVGRYAFVGAGAVVTHDVPAHAVVVGNPARPLGWMCTCGERLGEHLSCEACGRTFVTADHGGLEEA